MNKVGITSTSRFFYIIFRTFGLWFSTDSVVYKIYAVFMHVTFTLMFTVFMVMNLLLVSDIREATHALYMTLTIISMYIRVLCFLWYNSKIRLCLATIHDFDIESIEESNLLEIRLKPFLNLVIAFFIACIVTLVLAFVQVLFWREPGLPFPCWFPLDWKNNSRDYWVAYGYETCGMIMGLFTNVGIQMFSCYLMYMMRFWMEVLGVRLITFGDNVNIAENRSESTQKKIDETDVFIVQCISSHQTVLELKNAFQDSFAIAFFCDICTSGITICMLAYQLAVVSAIK